MAGERFDLIVSNPPYVISPENDLVYRDSGDEPGALCGRLIHDVPDYLTARGYATFLVSWPLIADRGHRGDQPSRQDAIAAGPAVPDDSADSEDWWGPHPAPGSGLTARPGCC